MLSDTYRFIPAEELAQFEGRHLTDDDVAYLDKREAEESESAYQEHLRQPSLLFEAEHARLNARIAAIDAELTAIDRHNAVLDGQIAVLDRIQATIDKARES